MEGFLPGFLFACFLLIAVFVLWKIVKVSRNSTSSADSRKAREVRKRVLNLHRSGHLVDEIAKTVGVSKGYVLEVTADSSPGKKASS